MPRRGSPEQFTMDVQAWADKAGRRTDTVIQEFLQDIGQTVVEKTPVDTGFLRSNWILTTGARGETRGQDFGGNEFAAGAHAIDYIALIAAQSKTGQTFTFINNASYAANVEFGTQFMEGRAMVRQTISQAPSIMQETIRRISR